MVAGYQRVSRQPYDDKREAVGRRASPVVLAILGPGVVVALSRRDIA